MKEKPYILVVDDDPVMLRTIKGWLEGSYQVTMVNSGMNAITYLAKNKPDLILLDYEMPITTGPQVMEMIRSEPGSSDIPIIFLTGKSDKASVMSVMALKPQGYMLKTMTKEQILETVDNFFATKKWKSYNILMILLSRSVRSVVRKQCTRLSPMWELSSRAAASM